MSEGGCEVCAFVHVCRCTFTGTCICVCMWDREGERLPLYCSPPPFPPGQCQAADMYVEQLRDTIRHSVPKGRLAAFFAETIQVSKLNNFLIGFVKCKLSRLP